MGFSLGKLVLIWLRRKLRLGVSPGIVSKLLMLSLLGGFGIETAQLLTGHQTEAVVGFGMLAEEHYLEVLAAPELEHGPQSFARAHLFWLG